MLRIIFLGAVVGIVVLGLAACQPPKPYTPAYTDKETGMVVCDSNGQPDYCLMKAPPNAPYYTGIFPDYDIEEEIKKSTNEANFRDEYEGRKSARDAIESRLYSPEIIKSCIDFANSCPWKSYNTLFRCIVMDHRDLTASWISDAARAAQVPYCEL